MLYIILYAIVYVCCSYHGFGLNKNVFFFKITNRPKGTVIKYLEKMYHYYYYINYYHYCIHVYDILMKKNIKPNVIR